MDEDEDQPTTTPDWRDALAAAVGFFTVLPVRAPAVALGRVAWAFPVIGAGVGLAAGLAFALARGLGLGAMAAGVVAVIVTVTLTGALHEDGLADTADGLGVRGGREARLAALRASGIGAFGVLALILVTLGRVAALAQIGAGAEALGALIAAGALSRAALAPLMHAVPAARGDGLSAAAGAPSAEMALVAIAVGTGIAWLAVGLLATLAGLVFGGMVLFGVALLARRLFGGQTGDVLGAAQQLVEFAVLLVVAALA
ncbi:MAG: adenosylcobinamide-GDP ribazoletransferase [Alphaproteobacteria bacterium]